MKNNSDMKMASNSAIQNNPNFGINSNKQTDEFEKNCNSANSSVLRTSKPINKQSNSFDFNFANNGYRVSPKIMKRPTKAEIDFHLENFIMSRKIALNGGNELRIDDKNISLHLNNGNNNGNPFANSTPQQIKFEEHQKRQYLLQQQQQQNKMPDENHIFDRSLPRAERPHNIPILSNLTSNNDSTASKTATMPSQSSKKAAIYMNKLGTSLEGNELAKELNFYTPPQQMAPQPQPQPISKRSQSIPRQMIAQNPVQKTVGGGIQSRPHSLDRYVEGNYKNQVLMNGNGNANSLEKFMKPSASFHGSSLSTNYDNLTDSEKRKSDRPLSFAYGTVPEQVYLEGQLRMYSEQLKYITESVRKYSEQSRLLNELKRQQHQQKNAVPSSKSDSKLSMASKKPLSVPNSDGETPSHQLKIFLESIRSSIKEPSLDQDENETKEEEPEIKTPSDQLRKFLDEIRSNQVTENRQRFLEENMQETPSKTPSKMFPDNQAKLLHEVQAKMFQETPSKMFPESQVNRFQDTQNKFFQENQAKILQEVQAKMFQETPQPKVYPENQIPQKIYQEGTLTRKQQIQDQTDLYSKNMDQILDDFNQMASALRTTNYVDYLRKCAEALKQTTEQIRLQNAMNNNGSDDSSCSTTPGSIREAVQNLLSQPNGFQIMDNRMSIFIDIMEQQDRLSQVNWIFR